MGQPKPNNPPPKPKKVGFYEYCEEPTCNWHYLSVREVGAADAKPDAKCPNGHKIQVFKLDNQAELPETSVTVVAIPGRPYGGFVLQVGDDDSQRRWEGGVAKPLVADPPDDAHHTNAKYVAELQRDLMRLGYFSKYRIGNDYAVGKFTMAMVGGILALKADLATAQGSRGYGVPTERDFTKITKNPKPPAPSPIYWEPRLTNPRALFSTWEKWNGFIGKQREHANTWKQLASKLRPRPPSSFKFSIAAPKGSGSAPDTGEQTFADADEELDWLTATRPKIGALPFDAGDAARKSAIEQTLKRIDTRVKALQTLFDNLAKFVTAYDGAVAEVGAQLQRRLQEVSFIDEELTVSRSTIDWQLPSVRASAAAEFKSLVQSQHTEAKARIERWLKPDGELSKMLADIDAIVADVAASKNLSSRAGPALAKLKSDVTPLRPGFQRFFEKIRDLDAGAWCEAYRKDLREYTRIDPPTAYAIKTMIAERKLNGRLAYVQPEGAELAPWKFEGRELGEKPLGKKSPEDLAFGIRALGELVQLTFPAVAKKYAYVVHYAMLVNESGWTQWSAIDGGFKFITMGIDWWNLQPPKGGGGLQAAVFDEFVTWPGFNGGWAMNRGWGLSQNSPGDESSQQRSGGFVKRLPDGTTEDHSDEPAPFLWRSGLPIPLDAERVWPASIASSKAALQTSIRVFYDNWRNLKVKRDCTFENAKGEKYDCQACLARFKPDDFIHTNALLDRLKGEKFAPKEAAFVDEFKAKWALDHKLDDDDKKQKGFASPEFVKALDQAKKRAVQAESAGMEPIKPTVHALVPETYRKVYGVEAVSDPMTYVEQPCSWLTLRGAYAGMNNEGMGHVREVVAQIQAIPIAPPPVPPNNPAK